MTDPKEIMIELGEGNPGALSVLMQSFTFLGVVDFESFGQKLKDKNLRGSRIWESYKDVHRQDIAAFVADHK